MKKLCVLIFLFAYASLQSADGDLDSTFGSGGIVTTNTGGVDLIHAVLIQPDNKIVAVGAGGTDIVVARYSSNGTLDPSFGGVGYVVTNAGGTFDEAHAVVLQPDGKIIAVGFGGSGGDFVLVRYHTNGSLDTSFGTNGIILTNIGGSNDEADSAVLLPDGKIIVGGRGGSGSDITVVKYHADGSLDTSFGTDGIVMVNVGGTDHAAEVLLQPDGKIIAAGRGGTVGSRNVVVVRLNADGSLDTSFGSGGIVTTDISGDDIMRSALLQPDGKIVVAGQSEGVSTDFSLVRYNTDGSLDDAFGTNGIVTTNINGGDGAYAVLLQSDGKIVVAGEGGAPDDFVLVRYESNGGIDTSFGNDGIVVTNIEGGDVVRAAVLQPDGKIVAGGQAGATENFALARYVIDSITVSPFARNLRAKFDLIQKTSG